MFSLVYDCWKGIKKFMLKNNFAIIVDKLQHEIKELNSSDYCIVTLIENHNLKYIYVLD